MNKTILVGRLARDPELRTTQSGTPVASFTVACDRRFTKQGEERQADFINCVAWNKTAEFVSKYFTKGMRIALEGRIQTRTYDDNDGNKRFVTEVVAEAVEFAQSRNENGNNAPSFTPQDSNGYSNTSAPAMNVPDGFMPMDTDDDLPF